MKTVYILFVCVFVSAVMLNNVDIAEAGVFEEISKQAAQIAKLAEQRKAEENAAKLAQLNLYNEMVKNMFKNSISSNEIAAAVGSNDNSAFATFANAAAAAAKLLKQQQQE